ncbi:GTPase HflX [Shewanella litorisediminis]|uniref:GTPase HflX n=1 Tax=Shewanella litorisediminis TaxID=1173586 RepID=A0ABX7G5H3_9GAMM|nr:GTPase HflX [Shewanella litorisediminis]MCL2920201.1 GTPase HflX [Shewanella litorisediminis]QRH02493.1 GTPase HflX [Shewanella litorisediminis]
MPDIQEQIAPRALLISIHTPNIGAREVESSLAELARLVSTLGFAVHGTQTQRQQSTKRLSVLGSGKLEQLARMTGALDEADDSLANIDEAGLEAFLAGSQRQHANVVVFDCDLSPMQLRNLEDALGVEVFDRTGIIIEIFSRHASSKTARLQVELARLNYLTPRVRREHSGDRQRIGGRSVGESALELERRAIRDKQAELRRDLKKVQEVMQEQKSSRADIPVAALVGYTNAGKSSLMRALTGSDVLVENKLFATLDTTVRALSPQTQPRILVSDTVGFINKLPHDLVPAFHSTLEEARDASLLLYVVDASDRDFRTQLEVVRSVLSQISLGGKDKLLFLNKVDCLSSDERAALAQEFPDALQISALDPEDVARVHQAIVDAIANQMHSACFNIPYAASALMGDIHGKMQVIDEEYHESGMRITVRGRSMDLDRLNKRLLTGY